MQLCIVMQEYSMQIYDVDVVWYLARVYTYTLLTYTIQLLFIIIYSLDSSRHSNPIVYPSLFPYSFSSLCLTPVKYASALVFLSK